MAANGAIAQKYGDVVIVTSTQPKYEDPDAIIDEIVQGLPEKYIRIVQREQAIEKALSLARPGILLLWRYLAIKCTIW